MKDTRSIEEQVASLTEEQQNTIVKVDKIANLIIIIVGVLCVVPMIVNMCTIATTLSSDVADLAMWFNVALMVVVITTILGVWGFVKIKFPFYTGKRCSYIKKMRKNKK